MAAQVKPLARVARGARARFRTLAPLVRRYAEPVLPARAGLAALRAYPRYVSDWRTYARLPRAERLDPAEAFPCLFDRVATTPYDPHYFHQAVWATKLILAEAPAEHVDVGSEVTFVGMLSASVPVVFVDIRPLPVELPNFRQLAGDLSGRLPFDDGSVASLSCLHVAEHVGLGRYGDALTPDGTRRACAELARVLAPGGSLYFSVPVGRPRVVFNAHRVHAPAQILDYFSGLDPVEFSVVDDEYRCVPDADPAAAAALTYGCGLFRFRRR